MARASEMDLISFKKFGSLKFSFEACCNFRLVEAAASRRSCSKSVSSEFEESLTVELSFGRSVRIELLPITGELSEAKLESVIWDPAG